MLAATTAVAPRLGAGTMIAMVVVGQVPCSVTTDQVAAFGLAGHPTAPPQVDYAPTPLGHSSCKPVHERSGRAQAHVETIECNRSRYDERSPAQA